MSTWHQIVKDRALEVARYEQALFVNGTRNASPDASAERMILTDRLSAARLDYDRAFRQWQLTGFAEPQSD